LIIAITGLALWIDFTPTVRSNSTSSTNPSPSASPAAASSSPSASPAAASSPSASPAPAASGNSAGTSGTRRAPWPTARLDWIDVRTRLGLDLRGGTQVLLRSRDPNITAESLQVARQVIEDRVNGLCVSEATVQTSGGDRIIVELPDVDQPEQALATIRSTGKLELIDPQGQFLQPGQLVRTEGSPTPSLGSTQGVSGTDTISNTQSITATQELSAALSGPLYSVVADGLDLQNSSVQPGIDQGGRPIVSFTFNEPSAAKLQQFTAQNIGQPLTIVLDNRVVSSAEIQAVLPGSGQISSQSTADRDNLYNVLRYGSLPVGFDVETSRTISPLRTLSRLAVAGLTSAQLCQVILVTGSAFSSSHGLLAPRPS
jgi:preprotein translocase subunit SecD